MTSTRRYLDKGQGIDVRYGNLPHWQQDASTYFITYRTHDSIPNRARRTLDARRAADLRGLGIDPLDPRWKARLALLPPKVQKAYWRARSSAFESLLDRGFGRCEMRRPAIAQLVVESLESFDGRRYTLWAWVVMPNHVHILVTLHHGVDLLSQCRSWKRYSAVQINRALHRKGRFWQAESFDHAVRSEDAFRHFYDYVAENPRRAGLRPGEYALFLSP